MKPQLGYALKMIAGLVGYSFGLALFRVFYQADSSHSYFLILLPVLPLLFLVGAVTGYVRNLDEMWRKIYSEGMAFSGLATGLTCFTYLFLQRMGAPEFQAEWAFYLVGFYFAIGSVWAARKY